MNAELIKGLRELADFLEANELHDFYDPSLNIHLHDRDKYAAAVKTLGTCEKMMLGEIHVARKSFSGGLSIDINCHKRNVCERVKVREKLIPAEPERMIPATIVPAAPERIEELYEWRCPPSLLSLAHESVLGESEPADNETPTPVVPPFDEPVETGNPVGSTN